MATVGEVLSILMLRTEAEAELPALSMQPPERD